MSIYELSMRHLKLEALPDRIGANIGEGLYTLTSSSFVWPWPNRITLRQVTDIRTNLFINARGER
jgi:hypothetical protein